MTVESFETNPTGGDEPGIEPQGTQPAAPAAPAERTYTQRDYDRQFADARRSFESQAKREREAAIAAVRAEYERRNTPVKTDDPWSQLDPQGQQLMRAILDRELAPFKSFQEQTKQQQEDLAFRNDESEIRSRYKDYGDNRAAILQFAVANNITNLDAAYRAWKYDELSKIDPDAIGKAAVAAHLKRKVTQSAETPLAEGRGGGAPSTKTNFRGKDGKLDKDAMDAAALEILNSSQQ